MKRQVFFVLLMIGVGLGAHPITLYNTHYNNFERVNRDSRATINGQFLQLDNISTRDIIVTDSTSIDSFDKTWNVVLEYNLSIFFLQGRQTFL